MPTLLDVLRDASGRGVAIGHFNVSDLVGFDAVIQAARRLNVPVLIGVSEGERKFLGVRRIAALVANARQESGLPIFLNADRGQRMTTSGPGSRPA